MTRHQFACGAIVAGVIGLGALLVGSRDPDPRYDVDARRSVDQWETTRIAQWEAECRADMSAHATCAQYVP